MRSAPVHRLGRAGPLKATQPSRPSTPRSVQHGHTEAFATRAAGGIAAVDRCRYRMAGMVVDLRRGRAWRAMIWCGTCNE